MAEAYQMEAAKLEEMIGQFETKAIKEDLAIKKAVDFVIENAVEK